MPSEPRVEPREPDSVAMSRRVLLLLCVFALQGCADDPASIPVPIGTWGGAGVELHVTATGAVLPDLAGCFEARIPQPLVMDHSGRFAVDGTWVTFPLGSRPGIPSPGRFLGLVRGTRMTLTATVGDYSSVFLLNYGSPPTPPSVLC